MGWVIKDQYEDEYDFEMDRTNLEMEEITSFSCPKLRIIEVPVDDDDQEMISKVYEILYPGLFEDMSRMMEDDLKDPYMVKYFYKIRKSDSNEFS